MKRKISVRLSESLFERLEAAAKRPGANKTAIVEAALNMFLSADTSDHAALLRRLNWMSRQLEQLERSLKIVNETTAAHARYHLTVTPPLPTSDQRAACAIGFERFEVFAAQVGRRVHLGTPLMRETLDRITTTKPDLFADGLGEAKVVDQPPETASSAEIREEPTLPAAAPEGGSNGYFPERIRSRLR
jgi:predicted transcriptional regulator